MREHAVCNRGVSAGAGSTWNLLVVGTGGQRESTFHLRGFAATVDKSRLELAVRALRWKTSACPKRELAGIAAPSPVIEGEGWLANRSSLTIQASGGVGGV